MHRVVPFVVALALVPCAVGAQTAAEKGKQVYTSEKCAICHAIGGVGNKKGPLDMVGSKLSAGDIRSWITSAPEMAAKAKAERKPPMKAYPKIAADDLEALVAYLKTQK